VLKAHTSEKVDAADELVFSQKDVSWTHRTNSASLWALLKFDFPILETSDFLLPVFNYLAYIQKQCCVFCRNLEHLPPTDGN